MIMQIAQPLTPLDTLTYMSETTNGVILRRAAQMDQEHCKLLFREGSACVTFNEESGTIAVTIKTHIPGFDAKAFLERQMGFTCYGEAVEAVTPMSVKLEFNLARRVFDALDSEFAVVTR